MPLDFSITVHGEFETMRQVLTYLSTIINSSAYKGLITTLFILVFTLMLMSGMLEVLFGNFRTFDSWVKAFFTGVFIYAIFLSGAARVTVYDDITGRSHTQGNIPPGIALMMWFPNRIATGIEDLVRSYLAPSLPLSPFAYEIGVDMMRELYTGKLATALSTIIHPEVWRSAGNYMEDCVALLAAREGSYAAKLYSGTSPYQDWARAQNGFFYTYTSLNATGNPLPEGTPDENVSCTEAWNRLNAYFRSDAWRDVVDFYCKLERLGGDAVALSACRDIITETVSRFVLGGYAMSAEEIAKNVFAGTVFYNFISSLDSSIAVGRVAAYTRAQAELSGRGIVAQDWIPIMKTVFFILACALIPLVFLFIATGTGGVKYLLGLFVWWMIWCGVDVVVYCLWISRADQMYEAIEAGAKLGLDGLQSLWFLSSKALALLGSMRSLGFLIAGTMTYALFRFGGSALAHMATILGGTVSASAPKVAGYVTPEEQAWSQTYEALAKYNRQLAEYRAYRTPDFFRMVAEGQALRSMGEVKGAHEFAERVGGGSPVSPGTMDLYSRAVAGGLIKTTASGLAAGEFSLSAWRGYYGLQFGKDVLTSAEIRRMARVKGMSAYDFLTAVAQGRAGAEVAEAVRWDGWRRFFSGASGDDIAGFLSGKTLPSTPIERKLSEWTGLPTYVFSDLKVKDFAIDPRTGKPIFTFTGSLDRNDLLDLAGYMRRKGYENLAAGFERIAETQGSMKVSEFAIGPNGELLHLVGDAGGETRFYDLYHGKEIFSDEAYREGKKALSAKNERDREILEWLRAQAEKKGWIEGVKELDYYLTHPNEAGFFRWTTTKDGELATLEVKRGDRFEALDFRALKRGREDLNVDREHADRTKELYISYGGHTYRLKNAIFDRQGHRITVEGVDSAGNRVRVSGMIDSQLSGDGHDWRSSIVLTGVEKEIVDAGGYGRLKAGEDFAGKAPISSLLVRDRDRAARYIRDTVHNEADAQALARKFTEELGIVKAKSDSALAGKLEGALELGFKWDKFIKAGIGGTAKLEKINRDMTTVDLVEAYAYDILRSDLLSAEEKAEALLRLRNIVYESMATEKVGRGFAVDATVGPESGLSTHLCKSHYSLSSNKIESWA